MAMIRRSKATERARTDLPYPELDPLERLATIDDQRCPDAPAGRCCADEAPPQQAAPVNQMESSADFVARHRADTAGLVDRYPDGRARRPEIAHILQFLFNPTLPAYLQVIALPFENIGFAMADTLPENPELTVCLRKLLEAKDAAVRARVAG